MDKNIALIKNNKVVETNFIHFDDEAGFTQFLEDNPTYKEITENDVGEYDSRLYEVTQTKKIGDIVIIKNTLTKKTLKLSEQVKLKNELDAKQEQYAIKFDEEILKCDARFKRKKLRTDEHTAEINRIIEKEKRQDALFEAKKSEIDNNSVTDLTISEAE